ncbi:hypothetical protein HDV00_012545 [Rhizophlyctis rosea]|nr:hypothetical protein HDV00_012545 [Rhizophlyctis rosea]
MDGMDAELKEIWDGFVNFENPTEECLERLRVKVEESEKQNADDVKRADEAFILGDEEVGEEERVAGLWQ